MRDHLVKLIGAAAREREDMVFLTGDLGFSVVEPLQELLGSRFINAGISEANMVSMAASLGACGFEPYLYSITPFITARCYEQIRNDVCYHEARVRLIGIGAGFSYGTLGPSHHALEDATIMSTLPGMTVFSPGTLAELDQLFALSAAIPGPIYYRVGRENGPERETCDFTLERPVVTWTEGRAINIVASGSITGPAFKALELLQARGVDARLITVPVIAPFPAAALAAELAPAPTVVVFEGYEGNPLEASVGKLLAEMPSQHAARFLNAGCAFAKSVGGTDYQRRLFGLDAEAIAGAALEMLDVAALRTVSQRPQASRKSPHAAK